MSSKESMTIDKETKMDVITAFKFVIAEKERKQDIRGQLEGYDALERYIDFAAISGASPREIQERIRSCNDFNREGF